MPISPPSSTLPPVVLSFAASDPTGGAGVQADLAAISAWGGHGVSVLTALTVQDSVGVSAIYPVEAARVEAQARAVFNDMRVDAVKIGLAGSAENIAVIAALLGEYPACPVVVDPVLASGRGDTLADGEAIDALCRLLLPRTTVLTPNVPEARRLTGVREDAPLAECARRLLDWGCGAVLLTGTHETTPRVINTWYDAAGLRGSASCERLPENYHGSGCTLAAALAAALAFGLPLDAAIRRALAYTWRTLAAGWRLGRGQSIPDRFFQARQACPPGAPFFDDTTGDRP